MEKLKKFIFENKLASLALILVVLMDLTFVARQYIMSAVLIAVSMIAVLAMIVNELMKD